MEADRNGSTLWSEIRDRFESEKKIYESVILKFNGIKDTDDVYNCSIPFIYKGEKYIFGRVEPSDGWADSTTYLFKESEPDVYERVPAGTYPVMQDPFIAMINGEMILGGVDIIKMRDDAKTYFTRFYRGKAPLDMKYFTTGPDMMKDIRLVQMPQGIGVFSRPDGYVGFTVINDISELDGDVIANAEIIDFIGDDGYGGVNQCYYLDSGFIGLIGHMVYPKLNKIGQTERVYINIAAVFDPVSRKTVMNRIIGTRRCYPASDRIRMGCQGILLDDTAFTSGIVMREDGKVDLYSGLSDALEGRAVIDYPFEGYGKIVYGTNVLE